MGDDRVFNANYPKWATALASDEAAENDEEK